MLYIKKRKHRKRTKWGGKRIRKYQFWRTWLQLCYSEILHNHRHENPLKTQMIREDQEWRWWDELRGKWGCWRRLMGTKGRYSCRAFYTCHGAISLPRQWRVWRALCQNPDIYWSLKNIYLQPNFFSYRSRHVSQHVWRATIISNCVIK